MPSSDRQRLPRRSPKLNKLLPLSPKRRRPELAVDTNLPQDHRRLPQQIYPPPKESNDRFINLNDIARLSNDGYTPQAESEELNTGRLRTGPIRSVKSSYQQKRRSEKAVPADGPPPPYKANDTIRDAWGQNKVPFVLQDPPKAKRNAVNRLVPQKVSTEISPSDAKIQIGMAVSPNAVHHHKASIGSEASHSQVCPSSRRQLSDKYGKEQRPPTIVVTPVNEDFEARFNGLSMKSERDDRFRPRSSVYSRYTNGISKLYRSDRTPPVPPLPNFANQDARRQESRSQPTVVTQAIPPELSSKQVPKDRALSICTTFSHDESGQDDSETPPTSNRFSSHSRLWNARSSQGWWNLVMSPFTPKSASRAFMPSPPPLPANAGQIKDQFRAKAARGALSNERALDSGSHGEDESQSAPAIESRARSLETRQSWIPKRADTAPAALDLGNIEAINIYRTPSHGSAANYYDRRRHYPSLIAPAGGVMTDRGLDLEDGWSPSQSVYRASRGGVSPDEADDERGLKHTPIPRVGEAAGYYDPDHDFSGPEDHRPMDRGDNTYAASRAGQPLSSGYRLSGLPPSGPAFVESPTPETTLEGTGGDLNYPERSIKGMQHEHYSPDSSVSDMVLDDGLYERRLSDDSDYPLRRDQETNAGSINGGLDRGVPQESLSTQQQTNREIASAGAGPHSDRKTELSGESGQKRPTFTERAYQEKASHGHSYNEKLGDGDAESDDIQRPPWYRRWLGLFILCAALLLVSLIVLLVLFVPGHHESASQVQAQWLNLTGFPPLPTGVATVVGAKSVKDVKGCVKNEALWSCAVPPAEGLSTTGSDQPNFRFLIRFKNGTVASNETLIQPVNSTAVRRDSSRAANAGAVVRSGAWSNFLFTSDPPPPSFQDQEFLGRTTDHVAQPYGGEETPFYISLLDPEPLQPEEKRSVLQKRSFHYPYPTPSSSATAPTASSGSATMTSNAPQETRRSVPPPAQEAELYPFAYAQPLRLFNRGRQDEHYGFYTYFDRSIYLSSLPNGTFADGTSNSGAEGDASNVRLQNAQSVCTFSQSRLLVQIWTRRGDVTFLPPAWNASIPIVKSTANDMKSPGSFPYAVTITLDRHGGDESKKGVFCYDIEDQHVLHHTGAWVNEDRSFGGNIVRPGEVPTNNGFIMKSGDNRDGTEIDGGSGGCQCQWES